MRSWRALAPRQNAKQTKVGPSSSSSRMSGLNIRIVSNIFSHAKWHVEAAIYRPGMRCAGSAKARSMACIASGFQGGTERPECKTPQLTLPCARMVFHGRNHPENSCNRTLAEPPGNSWNAPSGRFPLPLPAPRSASPTRVRAGRDQSPTDLPGELLNLASIMALRVCFWPFNLVFFLDANQLVIAA